MSLRSITMFSFGYSPVPGRSIWPRLPMQELLLERIHLALVPRNRS
jgi:hypothetical protein